MRTRDNRKRPDNPGRTPLYGARSIGSAMLLLSLIFCPAVAQAQPTERAPDTMEARLLACAEGRSGHTTAGKLLRSRSGFKVLTPARKSEKSAIS